MRVFLSPPYMNGNEQTLVRDAFASNYIAPCGPQVDAFERAAEARFGYAAVLATVSGTMALELLARDLNIRSGDTVIVSTLTFIASVGPFVTLGARPVFIDASEDSWCMDPGLLCEALKKYPRARAVIATDLYGQSCDLDALRAICDAACVPLIVDAAESVGATYRGRASGKGAWAAIYSYNGNKIITCGGGGMLLSDDQGLIARCRKCSSQAREPVPWYEHTAIGTNGRLGNIPAAIGLGQLRCLDAAVNDKDAAWRGWEAHLGSRPWVEMMPTAPYGVPNRWLSVVLLKDRDPDLAVRQLAERGIESRRVWKPMHLQPVFADAEAFLNGVSDRVFAEGLCLPSGRGLSADVMDEVTDVLEAL